MDDSVGTCMAGRWERGGESFCSGGILADGIAIGTTSLQWVILNNPARRKSDRAKTQKRQKAKLYLNRLWAMDQANPAANLSTRLPLELHAFASD